MSEINDPSTITPEKFLLQAKFFGVPLLSYILNLPEQEVETLVREGGNVDEKRLASIKLLGEIMLQVMQSRVKDQVIHYSDRIHLSNLRLNDGSSLFNKIRKDLNDNPAPQKFDDPVLECFSELCVDSYPCLLLPKDLQFGGFSSYFPIFHGTKIISQTFDAILSDPDLSNIFPTVGENDMDTVGTYYSSTGRGGSLQLSVFPSMLLQSAYGWMRSQNLNSLDAYITATSDVLNVLRKAARGEAVNIPILHCFEGIRLPEGTKFNAFNGTISNISDGILDILPQQGHPITSNPGGVMGFVFVSEIEFQLHITQPDDRENAVVNPWPIKMYDHDALHQITEKIALSIALAIGPNAPAAASVISTYISDPLNGGHSHGWNRRLRNHTNPITASAEDCQNIQEWCELVEKADDKKIDIAIRRFLSAVSKREDPIDSFVDSVIAMENLFGEKSEISLSLAASVSKLIETDAEQRKEIFKDVKNLYNRRSSIIHGTKPAPSYEEAIVIRDKSLGFVSECLRQLYRDHVELLRLNSSDRAKAIILN